MRSASAALAASALACANAAHLANLLHLGKHVVHGKALAQYALGLGGACSVGIGLGRLNDAVDVTHAQDALGHAVGVEDLERLGLLAHGDELDGLAGDGADRKRTAATGIAVELGHDDTVKVGALGKLGNDVDDVLAGHGVNHHKHLVGTHGVLDVDGLLHHQLVNLQATGGVDDDDVTQVVNGLLHGLACDGHGVGTVTAVDRHANLATEGLELVGSGGTVHVASGKLG